MNIIIFCFTLLTCTIYQDIICNTIKAKWRLKIIFFTNCTIIRIFKTLLTFIGTIFSTNILIDF
jgi:hypothetical protein